MAGLGILIYGALRAICGVGQAVENAKCMSRPSGYTDNGTPVYTDRNNKTYINGERIVPNVDYKTGKMTYVGKNTGTVYCDPEANMRARLDAENEERKQEAIKQGKLAYMKYDHVRKRRITCEISTGKYIAELKQYGDSYYKLYLPDDEMYCFTRTKDGDNGIEITKEQFNKLNLTCGSHFTSIITNEDLKKERRDKAMWEYMRITRGL